jgi:hypothetical protein
MNPLILFALAGAQVSYPPAAPLADVRSCAVTLDSSGNGTCDFTNGGTSVPFAGTPDVTHLARAMDTTNPLICNLVSVSTSAVTIHCWRTALLGLLTNLYSGSTSGAQVTLIARYRPS